MDKNVYPEKCFIAKISEPEPSINPYYNNIKTLDELLDRDKQRVADGFKKKIKLGKIIKPGKKGKFITVDDDGDG